MWLPFAVRRFLRRISTRGWLVLAALATLGVLAWWSRAAMPLGSSNGTTERLEVVAAAAGSGRAGANAQQQQQQQQQHEAPDAGLAGRTGAFDFHVADPVREPASAEEQLWRTRQQHVVAAFRHSWDGYARYAWGKDELHPVSRTGSDWFHLGLTAIDCLDTAWLMGQHDIFSRAREWVDAELRFDHQQGASNVFEITIRVLGGLLSSFHLSGDRVFLDRAVELADRLMVAFESQSGIPFASINLAERRAIRSTMMGGASSTSEATTVQLEFKYLSFLTGDAKYWNAAQTVMKRVFEQPSSDGLVPIFISADSGAFVSNEIRLGSRGDSYYEYLAKQWLQTQRTEKRYDAEYRKAVAGVRKHLLGVSDPHRLLFIGERQHGVQGAFSTKMDHLVCFMPATLALAATNGRRVSRSERAKLAIRDQMDLDLAEELTRSCYEMYHQTLTGLAPEIVFWRESASHGFFGKRSGGGDDDGVHSEGNFTAELPDDDGADLSDTTLVETVTRLAKRSAIKGTPATDILAYHRQTVDPSDRGSAKKILPHGSTTNAVAYDHETDKDTRAGVIPDRPVQQDFDIHPADGHNLLRPETVEALFVLYRITGKRKYREWGWRIFRAFERWCRVESGGYSSLNDVRQSPPSMRDKMETFFLGETLKYFYLLFGNDTTVPLTEYVFNTEAHPLPLFTPGAQLKKDLVWLE
ncbi:mannosyl-oligosaccharide alpha-1,2-mannosidase [Polyrhizophydium stewartii]|uniref:alpha-1,2-Mannosidase n=1 Tax=Polyrhizophydium stewartii TaxID=2732419 RepID=A0ABR4NGI2_9FUNG|nr:hypothetical protein HK105_003054 [Polyrhizophydium stewartii]